MDAHLISRFFLPGANGVNANVGSIVLQETQFSDAILQARRHAVTNGSKPGNDDYLDTSTGVAIYALHHNALKFASAQIADRIRDDWAQMYRTSGPHFLLTDRERLSLFLDVWNAYICAVRDAIERKYPLGNAAIMAGEQAAIRNIKQGKKISVQSGISGKRARD